MTDLSTFAGTWQAVGYTMERGELAEPVSLHSDPAGVAFLDGTAPPTAMRPEHAEPEPGQITIQIGADGGFTQSVAADNTLYLLDAEGCESRQGYASRDGGDSQGDDLAFDGRLVPKRDGATVVPSDVWIVQRGAGAPPAQHLRYHDGDTSVSDVVLRDGDTLSRVIRVATDGMYATVVRLVYARCD